MSDKSEGPGWWIASDGKWYPPELHPSVRDDTRAQAPVPEAAGSQPRRWQGQAGKGQTGKTAPVGRQFPDLFQRAIQESHLADMVTVVYDGEERRSTSRPATSPHRPATTKSGGGTAVPAGVPGATIGAPAKRKWRKSH